MTINFNGIRIRRDWNGKLKGNLEIEGDYGNSTLNLTEDLCKFILDICADNIVAAASEIANGMKSEAALLDLASDVAIKNGEDE